MAVSVQENFWRQLSRRKPMQMAFNRWPQILNIVAQLNYLVCERDAGLIFNTGSNPHHFTTKQNL